MFFLFGTKAKASTIDRGEFHCPTCGQKRRYERKEVRKMGTAYFVPVVSMGTMGEYVECTHCGDAFDTRVLSYHPELDEEQFAAVYRAVMLKVMVAMAEADGEIHPNEIKRICSIYEEIAGFALPDEILEDVVNDARTSQEEVLEIVASYAGRVNDKGRELVIRAAFHILAADGDVRKEEIDFLSKVGGALGLTSREANRILEAVQSEGKTDFTLG